MEPIQGTHSEASDFASDKDIISSMPENVIANIMDRLEIKEAVRTSILSRDWRFKWTLLTQLVFDSKFFDDLCCNEESGYGRLIVSRLLLLLKGALTKFSLDIEDICFEDINSWLMFLSRKGIEDLTLRNRGDTLKLPTHVFSCQKLKHLELQYCCICPMPGFSGFPNLLSLNMSAVTFESYTCGEFLAQCPLLEILNISYDESLTAEIQLVELAKLENLKVLSLPLSKLDRMITCSSIVQLMGDFSKLQELTLDFWDCESLAGTEARKNVRTTLPCLKTLKLWHLELSSGNMVSCAVDLISGSSKLHTLEIIAAHELDVFGPPAFRSSEVDYSRMGQLKLRKVTFHLLAGWKQETYLIKSLLSSSPILKNMSIRAIKKSSGSSYDPKEVKFAVQLLKFHRASPLAEIDLSWLE